MDKYGDGKSSRNRWKDENRNPKLYDERTDTPGQSQNGKNSSSTTTSSSSSSSKNQGSKQVKNDIVNQLAQSLPEDIRISKLLRRLETEGSVTGTIEICQKLKAAVQDQTNASYIRRSFDMLANSLISIMKECHSPDAMSSVCQVFGMIGFVMRNDFPLYKSWICKTYKSVKLLRAPMMNALEKTLRLDSNDLRLSDQMGRLMELLRDFLEQTDDYKVFIAITQVIMAIAQNYNPRYFKTHFSNIVDIVIGWMMEPQQKSRVKNQCSIVLQSFKIFWQNDTKFTLDLLGQLLEDIEGCTEKVDESGDGSVNYKEFGAFVGVFNAIIKSIYVSPEALVNFTGKDMMIQCVDKILKVALLALKEDVCIKETVFTINEFTLILLDCRKYGVEMQMETIQNIIEIEMENLTKYTEDEISSFLFLVTQFIGEFKSELTVNFITNLFNIDGILLKKIIFNDDKRIKNGLIKIYHDVLALKNVPVLQAAYKCILEQFGACMRQIPQLKDIKWIIDVESKDESSNEIVNEKAIIKAQYALNFNLTAISKLATMQNSIIAMYSLVPSILEVLLGLQIWRTEWNDYELIQYSALLVISEHCLKNSNFISSSSLLIIKPTTAIASSWLSDSSPTESPVSQHFKYILEFVDRILKSTPSLKQFKLILDWLDKLIQQTTQYAEQLKDNQNFVSILKRINHISNKYNDEVSLKVAACNDSLYAFDVIHSDIFISMSEACAVQMCSVNPEIRRRFSFILSRIPLKYTLEQAKSPSGINQEAIDKITEMENWHLSLGSIHGGELRAQYFQQFINHISFTPNASNIDQFILHAFKNCWFNGTETAEEYKRVTLKDVRTLCAWIQWEAARFCVNNKLKTPLGKAQDTFIKIEGIIREHARVLTLKDKSKSKSYKHVLANQRNVRILLGFMESLEKAIYNAAEGSAFAIPPPEKPARTFFRLNASTCNEWFTRNRLAIHQLALHCMELEMVIRCSQSILKEMVAAGKMNEIFFDQILMSLTWALLRNFESDALIGLYIWVKNITGRKLYWIKMASEQAAGHREIAADGYAKVLRDEKLEPKLYDFIADQRKCSLLFTGNMNELKDVLEEEDSRNYKPSNVPILKMTKEQIDNIIIYEKTKDPSTLAGLSLWETLEEGPEISSNYSVHNLISLSENTVAMKFVEQKEGRMEKEAWEILQTLIQECLRTGSQEYPVQLNIINHLAAKIKNKDVQSLEIEKKYGSLTMFIVSLYSEFLDAFSEKGEQQNINLKIDLVAAGRKELNFKQCTQQLFSVYKCVEYKEHIGLPIEQESLPLIKDCLMSSQNIDCGKVWSENVSRAVYEHCKMLYVAKNQHFDAIQFGSTAAIGIKSRLMSTENVNTENLNKLCVKFYMKIAEWLQNESEELLEQQAAKPLKMLVHSINDEEYIDDKMPLIDAAVGKLLQSGVKQCPQMPKVWSSLANWCYRWGRKMIESKTDSQGLRAIDSSSIIELIPEASSDDVEKILKILNEQQIIVEDEDIGPNESSSTEIIEGQLRMIPLLQDSNSDFINSIIKLWKQAHRDVYRYYEMCASAYFKFLLLSSSSTDMVGDSSVVTATLRLLRLIVKHALGLQEVLEEGLAKTPSDPWKVIIPQLFSRLNHHEPYVRKRVSELLCRVAMDSPHLIIFPTVVGAQDKSMDVTKLTSEHSSNTETEWKNSSLTFCFTSLLDTLSMQSPKTVSQVQLFVRELRRIALLWDELWLLSLSQVYAENVKKLQNFEAEFQGTDKSPEKISLFTEKYRLLMRPVVFVMERLQGYCSKTPETNNERAFQEKFLTFIDEIIVDLKKPFDPTEPIGVFGKLKSLYQLMQQRVHKRMNHSFKMSDISPVLASLRNTNISMPGVMPSNESEAVYIQSVDDIIHILPTKTKPKKLAFYGSDGKRYTFLFKGMEDLHLDERIMQFLSIANLMMKKSVDSDGKVTHYRAQHYSVIPLGPRSGLISWVDGVIPIFSIYKKWQQREAANPRKDKQYVVLRPSELFYNKITPLLKEHSLKPTDNRKDWPLSVQKKAFEDLKAETPRDLLAKEFWCTASTAAHWRQIVRNYSVSLAVMSVIGYIIGLGDRHLDNILVKLASGDIVHIDYNVCFEKGKTLRVPEKVPFRMTQNIEEALGLTGIEGSFRLCCEHVLKSLKRGRETLLTLLEAFVYDPLIDWAIGEDNNATGGLANISGGDKGNSAAGEISAARKLLEREVTRDTLAIRFTEIKNDWTQNRDDVYNQLLSMKTFLSDLSNSRNNLQRLETQRNILSKQISLVRDVEALGSAMHSHSLNTLSQRYAIFKKKRNDVNLIKNILLEKAIESEKLIEDYTSLIKDENIISNSLIDMKSTTSNLSSEFEIVKDFLENSNQGQMYIQSDQLRNELNSLIIQRKSLIETIFEMILQYVNVIHYYPHDHVQNHRLTKYSTWCRSLTENKSQEFSRQIAIAFHASFGDVMLKENPDNVIAFNFSLQTYLAELNYRLQGNYQKYQQFIENDGSFDVMKTEFIKFMNESNDETFMAYELTKMTKRFITIETSAYGTNNLADLLINDRWFMDEIMIQASFMSNMTNILIDSVSYHKKNPLFVNSLECFTTITEMMETTERIKHEFQLNIIPQTLKGIISQDKSVLDMISSLSNITKSPISELLTKLEEDFVNCIQNPNQRGLLRAAELSESYNNMYTQYQQQDDDSLGKKIFMSCHGAFEELCRYSKKIMSFDKLLSTIPDEWTTITEIEQARMLFITPMKTSIFMTLDQLFMVKRIQTLIEFFGYCLQIAWAFKGSGVIVNLDIEFLSHPLKVFIADLFTKCVFGRGSYSLSIIVCSLLQHKMDELNCGNKCFNTLEQMCYQMPMNSYQMSHCEKLFTALEEKFRQQNSNDYYQRLIHQESEYVKHVTWIISCHHWLHEDYFMAHPTVLPPIRRASILMQCQTFIQTLSNWSASIHKIDKDVKQCTGAILQRLKWATGANPLLNELLYNFESISRENSAELERDNKYAEHALKCCIAIINYEMLRYKTPKAIVSDEEFLNFLQQWENVCISERNIAHTVNPIEEGIVELLDPEGPIERLWIENITSLIDDMINQVHNEIDTNEKCMVSAQDNLHLSAHKLRNLMSTHHRISADTRNLLKSILKYDECGTNNEMLREYFTIYKAFIDNVTELHGNVLSKDFTDSMVKQISEQVERSLAISNEIYNGLFSFEKTLGVMLTDGNQKKMKMLRNQSENYSIEHSDGPVMKKVSGSNQKEQRKNVYGVSVWRRIRSKLEGRDPDANKTSRVQEQVDWMIREALNQDNLALLYEGFTSWV
ncbi:serine/threonine-protein kinase Smg1 [Chironomus tepperi]|uniref:serine/threonine-protein kinase Smg1 n=1 Tax=Chironomus tepperi TaxID=113505 RepID=UPI00391F8CD0